MEHWLLFSLFVTLGGLGYIGLYLVWRSNRPSASIRDYWREAND